MANDIFQQITATEALGLASVGPQEFPIMLSPEGNEGPQRFEVSEIIALLKELGDEEWVRVYFAYGAKKGTLDYLWLNGVVFGSYALDNPTPDHRVAPAAVDSDHVQFLTTMSVVPSQTYPHQICVEDAKAISSLGIPSGPQAFHVSGIFALLATIESQTPGDEKKYVYVYYAYDEDRSLKSVVLGSRPLSPEETNTAKDPRIVEFLDHTNEYPCPRP